MTLTERIQRIKNACTEKGFTFIKFDNKKNEYIDKETKILLKCDKCGNIFARYYNNLVHKEYKCPECGVKYSPLLKEKEVINRILHICKLKQYEFYGFCDRNKEDCQYIGSKETYLKLKCNKCGYEWDTTTYNNFLRGRSCPNCSKHRKVTESEAISIIQNKCVEKQVTFLGFCNKNGEKINWNGTNKTNLLLKCDKCGEIWHGMTYGNFTTKDNSCPICGLVKRAKKRSLQEVDYLNIIQEYCIKHNYIFLYFSDKDGNEISWQGTKTRLKLKCNKCGNIWFSTTYEKIKQGRGCPICNKSHLENNLIDFIKNHTNLEFKIGGFYKEIDNLQLDIFFPSQKVAIECQGQQHFKPVCFGGCSQNEANENFKTQIERDERKRKLCEENGIRLLYYSNLGIEYPYKVHENLNELIKEIKNIQ